MSSYEYHQILQFLYFEGYADSYENAEYLFEQLSDEEFEELNESRRKAAHSFPLTKQELKYVASLERMSRGDYSRSPAGAPSTETRSARKTEPEEQKPRRRTTDMSKVIVAHYLFDEGYAKTIESAELMVEGISAEWVEEILDEKFVRKMQPEGPDHRAKTTDPTVRPRRLNPMPDTIKYTESGFDPIASRRSPGARKRKDERRKGTGGFRA